METAPPDREEIHHGNQFLKILRHGSWYFVASTLTKAAGLVLVPIYTRYLPPSQYGILGTLDAVSRFLPMFMSLYIDASFVRYYYAERAISPERVRTLYSTQFWFVAVWGTFVLAIGLVLAPFTIQPLVDTPYLPFMPLVLVAPLFTQLALVGSQRMRAELRAKVVSAVSVIGFIATAAVSLTLLIGFGYGVESLLWGLAVGPFVSFVVFTVMALRERVLAWTFEWETLWRGLKFSIPLIPNIAGGWISSFSNRLVVAHFGSIASVGLLTISAQLGNVMYLVTDAVTQVQGPIGMSAMTEDTEQGKRQMSEFLNVFVWAALLGFLALTLFSREIVELVTASSYHSAYALTGVFALGYVLSAFYRPFTTVLSYHHRLWLISIGAILAAALTTASLFILVPAYGKAAAAWAFLADSAVYALWLAWWSQRTDPIPLSWRILGPTALLAAAATAAYIVLDHADPATLVAIAAKLGILAVYVGALFVIPGFAPLRAGVVGQVRSLRARISRGG